MLFTSTRRPLLLRQLRSPVAPPRAVVRTVEQRSPEWRELAGACALIAAFLVMAMFG
jgi:hypothetical protein